MTMGLLEDVKLSLRVKSAATDPEVRMWIDAAIADMRRVGVKPELLAEDGMDPLAKAAVTCFVKASYGYDVDERARFEASYRSIVCGLLNSDANSAAEAANG